MNDDGLQRAINRLEELSNPDKNSVEISRDRVGNWRVRIDDLFTSVQAVKRDSLLVVACWAAIDEYERRTLAMNRDLLSAGAPIQEIPDCPRT